MPLSPEQIRVLQDLVRHRSVAALGTLHRGAPFVSMVPFALVGSGGALAVHVSRLAAHTQDMLADPRVSVLLAQPEGQGTPAQALARLTVQAAARPCPQDAPEHASARQAYLDKFPEAAPLFTFPDFGLFILEPVSARFVGGFAQAMTLTPDAYAAALGRAPDAT